MTKHSLKSIASNNKFADLKKLSKDLDEAISSGSQSDVLRAYSFLAQGVHLIGVELNIKTGSTV